MNSSRTMAPVTTFCTSLPPNNHHHHNHHHHHLAHLQLHNNAAASSNAAAITTTLNNLNRTKSLDNLNFEEKRQLISSTLSLAYILQQQSGMRSASFLFCFIWSSYKLFPILDLDYILSVKCVCVYRKLYRRLNSLVLHCLFS